MPTGQGRTSVGHSADGDLSTERRIVGARRHQVSHVAHFLDSAQFPKFIGDQILKAEGPITDREIAIAIKQLISGRMVGNIPRSKMTLSGA
ncbi:hypothetical protein NDU88_006744 [Pleurodeles waltl]|uniref:Uncharacterized protein n=1 Tax=Pleurodeles waltl TaxID=8319 RepID=A0AAV7TXX5_PLEWA|nr:hypothetical protein NDU88_006744 [Pleurodeles waltl]